VLLFSEAKFSSLNKVVWFSLIVITTYSFLLFWLKAGIQKATASSQVRSNKDPNTVLSVIVPFRNEKQRIGPLLTALGSQTLPTKNFELLFIDDQSTDQGSKLVEQFIQANPSFSSKLIHIPQGTLGGKKKAIEIGMNQAKGNYVVQTDADAIPSDNWLRSIHSYVSNSGIDLVVLPVFIHSDHSTLGEFDSMEYSSLQAIGMGMAAQKFPILCSGTNLVYQKSFYQQVKPGRNDENQLSGDDIFLLQAAIKGEYKIGQLLNSEVMVQTNCNTTFNDFISQRKRWAFKNKSIKDPVYQGVTILGLATNLMILLMFFSTPKLASVYLLIKALVDYLLLSTYYASIRKSIGISSFIINSILYPLYLAYLIIVTYSTKNSWKGRNANN
tara:strand:+ start:12378 stop:13532 length:1155 start_codon:yes stop_codon:yes gene_type:complete